MEPSRKIDLNIARSSIVVALVLLVVGMTFGLFGALQYILPGLTKGFLSFDKVRPLHVSSVVFWILLAATGSVLAYIQQHTQKGLRFPGLAKFQIYAFIGTVVLIIFSYIFGIFGGREYWEFSPFFALPLIIIWVMFLINVIASIGNFKNQPIYIWMWLTGGLFFLYTFIESYMWVFSYFSDNLIKDMTIQWKSSGSLVGSWNMLIYGSGIFLMDKILGEEKYGKSSVAFLIYFLGLFNLMFNWGHHIYTLPTFPFVKHISYLVSMTEIILFGRIIFQWKSSLTLTKKNKHIWVYRFLFAADIWVFLTLFLAILMSIPSVNLYTHGTHITVAHTMGATIGINSMLLLAFVYDLFFENNIIVNRYRRQLTAGFWLVQISLFVFWITLIGAGIVKSYWQMQLNTYSFSSMMSKLYPVWISFLIAGFIMYIGFLLIIIPVFKKIKIKG